VSFHEVSLPLALALGASGGPTRRTDVSALGSGRESRSTPWAHSRRRYDLGGAVRSLDQLHALIAFFEARRGRLHGFRFRDPLDWRSCPPSQTPSAFDQIPEPVAGEPLRFQLIKRYGDSAGGYTRPIRKPVAGTVRVAVGGVETSAFTLDAAAGLITLAAAPAAGAAVTVGFAFDTPVRFDADRLDIALDGFGAGRAVSVPLIEILV
jgi:uncharacterized protein (TIGR02217 family)